ncbi:Fukutin [Manis javanica]|nr:Fukutin [Manis javanica]
MQTIKKIGCKLIASKPVLQQDDNLVAGCTGLGKNQGQLQGAKQLHGCQTDTMPKAGTPFWGADGRTTGFHIRKNVLPSGIFQ